MKKSEILAKINQVFQEEFDDNTLVITEKTEASDIEDWDSLTHVHLITKIEKVFNTRFELDEILNFSNVGDMVELLYNKYN
jgi:acyl carrier protein